MHTITKTASSQYSAKQLYELVNDINAYPLFLPWCKKAAVLKSDPLEITASMTIAKGAIEKSIITKNTLTPHSSIKMEMVDGPFEHFHGLWLFNDIATGSDVKLDLEFSLKNHWLNFLIEPVLKIAGNTMVEAFVTRAKAVYA